MASREWSPAEVESLRREYGTRPPAEVALMLGRTHASVAQKAFALGLARRRPTRRALEVAVRRLHAHGLTCCEVARELRCSRFLAHKVVRSLGLSCNRQRPNGGRLRAAAARRLGFRNVGLYLNSRRRLRYANEHPGCTTRAQVAFCRALAAGPLPLAAARDAAGLSDRGARNAAGQLLAYKVIALSAGLYRLSSFYRKGVPS